MTTRLCASLAADAQFCPLVQVKMDSLLLAAKHLSIQETVICSGAVVPGEVGILLFYAPTFFFIWPGIG